MGIRIYPTDVLRVLHLKETIGYFYDYDSLNQDQLAGLEYLLTLVDKTRLTYFNEYFRNSLSKTAIAWMYNTSLTRVEMYISEILQLLDQEECLAYIIEGYQGRTQYLESAIGKMKRYYYAQIGLSPIPKSIDDLELPIRVSNALHRAGIHTTEGLIYWYACGQNSRFIPRLGKAALRSIHDCLLQHHLIPVGIEVLDKKFYPSDIDLEFQALKVLCGPQYSDCPSYYQKDRRPA